jgi:DNA-binding FrmR family transcriptional regulator
MRIERRKKALNRLKRIHGQVGGLVKMVEQDRYCIDLLTQLQAVRSATAAVEREILKDHTDHCLQDALNSDNDTDKQAKVEELVALLYKKIG